ncbi:MAG: VCBS repeat-containing protein [Candidatus Eisenbacteria bacterium]|nr:VCBS repeat-containing protein [Candidatus Eisenbacteria bacterium]
MTPTGLARTAFIAALLAGASFAHAATLEREFDYGPERLALASRGGNVEVTASRGLGELRAGRPDLPWVSERIELPDGQRIARIEVIALETSGLSEHVRLASAVKQQPGGGPIERTEPDPAYFARAGFQPETPVELGLQGYEDGHSIALLRVSPARWDAATGRLERISRVRVRLTLEADPGRPIRRERAGVPWLDAPRGGRPQPARLAAGGGAQPFRPTQLPSLLGSPVQYVIITSDALTAQFQQLADWKTQSGIPAVVRTLSFIQQNYLSANDDADRVRQFIRDAYQRWGTKYVLIGGDTDVMPSRSAFSTYYYGAETIPSDMYYQCLDGNWNADGDSLYGEGWQDSTDTGDQADLMPELWVGRAPASTSSDAQLFVNKTLQYEKTPMDDYENSILFFAEVLFPQNWSSGQLTQLDGAQLVEEVLPDLDANPALHYGRLYENYTDARWKPGALQELKQTVVDSLSRGYNLAVHVGHGYRNVMSCGDDNLTNNDALGLTNGNRVFNLYAIDCTSNAIDFACLGEAFLHAPNGGAVTNIGSTRVDFPTTGRYFQSEYFRLLFEDSVTTIGEAFAREKYASITASSTDNVSRWTTMTLLLLGDPELRIWTGRPRTLTVTAPSSIAVSDSQVTVHVALGASPFANARVTVFKANDDFASALTNAYGDVTLPFRPDSAGSLTLTVTGYDCRPVQSTVSITSAARPALAEQTPVIDDGGASGTSGNLNAQLDAGEVVDLHVPLRNNGTVSAPAASATLATPDGMVTIVNGSVSYGSIAAGASSNPATSFRISVPYTLPDQREIPFTLTVLDGFGGHTVQKLQIVARAPEPRSFAHSVVDVGGNSNGRPDPGEAVSEFIKLRNLGTGNAPSITLVLRSLDGLATISDSTAAFGDIAPGQEKQGDAVAYVPSSASAKFQLRISDSYGLIATQTLDLTYPATPLTLLATGAGTQVQLTWAHNTEPDLNGYNVYQATASGGPYTRINTAPTDRTSYYEVENALPLTTYYFKVSAVDSSGNESSQSSVVSVITNPPNHAVFPVSLGHLTPSSVAVDHLYSGYPQDIVAGGGEFGALYVWHPDGSAPIDADGQGTTYGDFTTRGMDYRGAASIADLDGTGIKSIVACTWDSSRAYVFDQAGHVKIGWPQVTGQVWAAPTIADLNNDGHKEILFANLFNGQFLAYRTDGSEWMDGDSNPATSGVFHTVSGGFNAGTAAVAPLEGGGVTDVIFGDDSGYLYAWRPDGTNVTGFPIHVNSGFRASPAVGYLDGSGDTQLEIAIPGANDSLYVFEANGARRTGFPVRVSTGGVTRPPSPALADINKDGYLDIVQAGTNGGVYVYDRNGATLPFWNGARYSGLYSSASESSPVVADINGDGWPDVVVGGEDATLTGLSGANAQVLPGFPIPLGGEVRGTPALCDCDGDGKTEIVLADWDGTFYMWDYDLQFSPNAVPPWPQFHHDALHTGYASAPVNVDVPPGGGPAAPERIEFTAPQPNPSAVTTRIGYAIPAASAGTPLDIAVFDLAGRRVRTLASGPALSGRFSVAWDLRGEDGARSAEGVYFVRFVVGSEARARKLIVLR